VSKVSWELFDECFRECYFFKEFIEKQLNEFNSVRQENRLMPE
jgi:hypothetical protein